MNSSAASALARLGAAGTPVATLPSLSGAEGPAKVSLLVAAALARASGVRFDARGKG